MPRFNVTVNPGGGCGCQSNTVTVQANDALDAQDVGFNEWYSKYCPSSPASGCTKQKIQMNATFEVRRT